MKERKYNDEDQEEATPQKGSSEQENRVKINGPNTDQSASNSAKIEEDSPKDLDRGNVIKNTKDADQKGNQEQDKEGAHTEIIYEEGNSPKDTNDHSLKIKLVAPFTNTYKRGERHVFATSKG